ncbi:hypothetical protein RJT34_18379 [Clitoria ternatea]|uniref:Uncharacterized protein n=1 Tax=Clitoria ternatea TaxID=43366 RepID=A0AAN9JAN9_CLITE
MSGFLFPNHHRSSSGEVESGKRTAITVNVDKASSSFGVVELNLWTAVDPLKSLRFDLLKGKSDIASCRDHNLLQFPSASNDIFRLRGFKPNLP